MSRKLTPPSPPAVKKPKPEPAALREINPTYTEPLRDLLAGILKGMGFSEPQVRILATNNGDTRADIKARNPQNVLIEIQPTTMHVADLPGLVVSTFIGHLTTPYT